MNFDRKNITDDILLQLYTGLIKPRLIEEKMINLIGRGKYQNGFPELGRKQFPLDQP